MGRQSHSTYDLKKESSESVETLPFTEDSWGGGSDARGCIRLGAIHAVPTVSMRGGNSRDRRDLSDIAGGR